MSKALIGLAVAAGLTAAFIAEASAAEPYRWCAIYSGRGGNGTNCGFDTIEQCRATVFGIGGTCEENPFYPGEKRPATKPRKRHRS